MTPKEKAAELVDSYFVLINGLITFQQVKQCALIAVNEIINANPYEVTKTDMDSTIDYWQEVKKEIEAL